MVMDAPVTMQRRRSLEQWKCLRISSSTGLVDIPVRNRDRLLFAVGCDEGLFRRILRHFSRSSGCPGVERQFSGLWALANSGAAQRRRQRRLRSWWRHEQQ